MPSDQLTMGNQDTHPERINIDPENVENGLAKLVLTLIEITRKLLEKQAIKRIEGGTLSEEEVERIGEAMMKLADKVQELKELFGLKDEDLNLVSGSFSDLL